MTTPLASPQLFHNERKSELLNISNQYLIGNAEYMQFVHFFQEAQDDLMSPEPENQKNSISSLNAISIKYGFPKDTLPPIFFKRLKELIFGNHASLEVIKYSLQLVESLIEMSPWTIDMFLQMNFPKIILDQIIANETRVQIDLYSYVLNSLLTNSEEAYFDLISNHYLDFLLDIAESDLPKNDALWVLVSIQSITVSHFFAENELFSRIVRIAIKYFEKNDSDIMCLIFRIFGRCLNSSQYLQQQEIDQITKNEIIQRAYDLIATKDMSDILSLFIYIDNYNCISFKNTINFARMGFIDLFYKIFTLCDIELQIQILLILKNAAVDPFEVTLEILKSPIVTEYLPNILDTGRLNLKKIAIELLKTLFFKVRLFFHPQLKGKENDDESINRLIFSLLQKFLDVIPDLLNCEEEELMLSCLVIMQFITSEIQIVEPGLAKTVLDLLSFELKEELYDILQSYNETLRSLSQNIIKSLDTYCSKAKM